MVIWTWQLAASPSHRKATVDRRVTGAPKWVRFRVRVQPRASRDELAGLQEGVLRVRLTAPPVDNAANESLIDFLADQLGVSSRMVQIVSGIGSRNKLIEVDPQALPALDRILSRT